MFKPESVCEFLPLASATNVTHLLWADRWIEVCKVPYYAGGFAWQFKNGRDAADWLLS